MFSCEKALIDAFSGNTKTFLKKALNRPIKKHFLIKEFDSFFGVADIIIGTYKPYLSSRNHRKAINLNWLNPIINIKKNESIELEEFKIKNNLSKRAALLRLNQYTDAGFLRKKNNGIYIVTNEYELITENVIAIEAKLKNWKRALFQARRYKKFSDYSYVLIDESHSASALSNIEAFKFYNIGLVSMNSKNFNIHFIPEIQNAKNIDSIIRINEVAYQYFTPIPLL